MRYILLILTLFTLPALADTKTHVVTDSLWSAQDGACNVLLIKHGKNVLCDTKGGRKAQGYILKPDLGMLSDNTLLPIEVRQDTRFIYALGANDYEDVEGFKVFFRIHTSTILAKGIKLLVVIPPDLSDRDMDPIQAYILGWCNFMVGALQGQLSCVSLNAVWDDSKTTDGIHPNAELSEDIADLIAGVAGFWN